jgi:hypothetical protein
VDNLTGHQSPYLELFDNKFPYMGQIHERMAYKYTFPHIHSPYDNYYILIFHHNVVKLIEEKSRSLVLSPGFKYWYAYVD